MNIYVDELPKSCGDCVFCKQTEYYYYCDKLHTKLGYINKEKDCPLQSLVDYTKQVRKEVLEQVYKVFTNEDVWKELKDWWLVNGNCKELKKCLDAMIEEKSVENIAKKFGHYKDFYQQLDLIQGENV